MPKKTTSAKQNADSLEQIAAMLENHAASLRAGAALLRAEPVIDSVLVKNESSRNVGLEYVGNWVDAAKRAAFEARIATAQNGVRSVGHAEKRSPKR